MRIDSHPWREFAWLLHNRVMMTESGTEVARKLKKGAAPRKVQGKGKFQITRVPENATAGMTCLRS